MPISQSMPFHHALLVTISKHKIIQCSWLLKDRYMNYYEESHMIITQLKVKDDVMTKYRAISSFTKQ